jgi:TolA-binding protein
MMRKEMKEDKFAKWLGGLPTLLKMRWRLVFRVVFCIVVIAGVILIMKMRRSERELSATRLLNRGEVVLREGKFNDAKTIFEEIHGDFPHTEAGEAALIYVGESFCHLGKLNEAEEVFNAYLAQYSKGEFSARAQEGLGYVMEERGDFKEAIDAYRKVYENYPKSYLCPQAILSIARCYEAMKEWGEAKNAYEELLSLYPWSSSANLARAYLDVVEWEIVHD